MKPMHRLAFWLKILGLACLLAAALLRSGLLRIGGTNAAATLPGAPSGPPPAANVLLLLAVGLYISAIVLTMLVRSGRRRPQGFPPDPPHNRQEP